MGLLHLGDGYDDFSHSSTPYSPESHPVGHPTKRPLSMDGSIGVGRRSTHGYQRCHYDRSHSHAGVLGRSVGCVLTELRNMLRSAVMGVKTFLDFGILTQSDDRLLSHSQRVAGVMANSIDWVEYSFIDRLYALPRRIGESSTCT